MLEAWLGGFNVHWERTCRDYSFCALGNGVAQVGYMCQLLALLQATPLRLQGAVDRAEAELLREAAGSCFWKGTTCRGHRSGGTTHLGITRGQPDTVQLNETPNQ